MFLLYLGVFIYLLIKVSSLSQRVSTLEKRQDLLLSQEKEHLQRDAVKETTFQKPEPLHVQE